MDQARSRPGTGGRIRGDTNWKALALALALGAIALAAWTLLAGTGKGPGTALAPEASVAAAGDGAFGYRDSPDPRLFRVHHASTAPRSAGPAGREEVPIQINRRSALAAARQGELVIELPGGARYPVRYERSESAPGGNWTFIGRVDTPAGDLAAVITFGRDGVFGLLPTPDGTMMEITTRAGQAFLRPAGGLVPPGAGTDAQPDYLFPPAPAPTPAPATSSGQGATTAPQALLPSGPAGAGDARSRAGAMPTGQAPAGADAEAAITLLAAYTSNLVSLRGTTSAVQSEYYNLVAVTNQAHIDSGSRARFSVAEFVQVDFPAAGWNVEALTALQAGEIQGPDVHALRDAAAADLVALIRPYAEGDPSCGIAWVPVDEMGGYRMWSDYGYSVTAVEDCGPHVLAHELGHNLGLMHDRDTVTMQGGGTLRYGAFPFSFGYRQDGPPSFATVMAYNKSGQPRLMRFSHPGTTLCGTACGLADQSDNVRSINLTADTTARFRDPPGTVSMQDGWGMEGEYTYVAVRLSSPAPPGGVSFDLEFHDGEAVVGEDYLHYQLGRLTIPEGGTIWETWLPMAQDAAVESDESFQVRLAGVQGATVFDDAGTITLVDDDDTVPLLGQLRFPRGETPQGGIEIVADQTVRGVTSTLRTYAQSPDYRYAFDVARGAAVHLSASIGPPYLADPSRLERIAAPTDGADITVVRGIQLRGEALKPADVAWDGAQLILWNATGDGTGYLWTLGDVGIPGSDGSYAAVVRPGVPLTLELRNTPAPFVRQLVEIPPLYGDAQWDIRMRRRPSLTVGNALVPEGGSGDGFTAVQVVVELSVPAPAGGVSFDYDVLPGDAEHQDYAPYPGTFHIPGGETLATVGLSIVGDDRGEPDESVQLRVRNIQGAAWNPGPGSVRILNDDRRFPGADFDGDGISDVLWRNAATGRNGIWLAADRATQRAITAVTDLDWRMDAVGDFDGDGASDIFWRNHATGANVVWNAGQRRGQRRLPRVTGQAWQVVAAGDFDGDGTDDLFWRHASRGSNVIWASGRHDLQVAVARVADPGWEVAGTGDLDGDGRDDVLWRHAVTGQNAAWRHANHQARHPVANVGNIDWKLVAIGDFDGDGRDDLVWRNRATGHNVAWLGADSAREKRLGRVVDQAWQVVAAGDYDDDGLADLLWRNRQTGANVAWGAAEPTRARALTTITNLDWEVQP